MPALTCHRTGVLAAAEVRTSLSGPGWKGPSEPPQDGNPHLVTTLRDLDTRALAHVASHHPPSWEPLMRSYMCSGQPYCLCPSVYKHFM